MTQSSDPVGRKAKEIFQQVVELAGAERDEAAARLCAGDEALGAEVASLLAAHDKAEGFLHEPTIASREGAAGFEIARLEEVGSRIGPYHLLERLGEGGFGVVYLAEQERPVRRRVALKLIKLGMDTRQVVARFEAERQALALMDHPNIARVYEAGATPTGRPYFVMELVKGVPITAWCDQHRLGLRQRLELFAGVCQAVQHAHQKGIIHRDIKPSNVLVTMQDERPVAKVIDFGIAKATDARLTERTVFTEQRQLIGTPEYMSPEQAEMGGAAADIDTRSDVYSLGVLLYELLTGTTPFEARELRSKAFAEMQRTIREVDPPRPSTRLSDLRDRMPTVAANRNTEPARLSSTIRGELDWIVMKCLEKDRSRRYQTAAALAADLAHYLADEPVSAAAPSRAYLARKFFRRHRVPAMAAAAFVLVLLAGAAGTTIALFGQMRQRAIAEQQRGEAQRQAQIADEQRLEAQRNMKEAQRQTEIAEAVSKFQVDMVAAADPGKLLGDKVTVFQVIEATARDLEAGRLRDQPLVEARLREIIGQTLLSLGRSRESETNLRRALELYRAAYPTGHRSIYRTLNSLGLSYYEQGLFDEAERHVSEAVGGNRAEPGPRSINLATTLSNLAMIQRAKGEFADAEPAAREAVELYRKAEPPDERLLVNGLTNLALLLKTTNRFDEAEAALREAIELGRRTLPEGDLVLATTLTNLAGVLKNEGKLDEAEVLCREALTIRRQAMSSGHPDVVPPLTMLASVLREKGDYAGAEPLLAEALEISRAALPRDHPDLGTSLHNYAGILRRLGRHQEAEPLIREALAIFEKRFGAQSWQTARTRVMLGRILTGLSRMQEAEAALLEGERAFAAATLGPAPADHPTSVRSLVELYEAWDQTEPGAGHGGRAEQWRARMPSSQPSTPGLGSEDP